MASRDDLVRIAGDVPWEHAGFRADLALLSEGTAAAARAYVADARVLLRLVNMVPRARNDTYGATPWTSFRTEIAVARGLSDRAAGTFIRQGLRLVEVLGVTERLLDGGLLPVHKAVELLRCLEDYDDDVAVEVDLELAEQLIDLPTSRIKHEVTKLALRLDPDAAAAQAAHNASARGVHFRASSGGTADIHVFGPAVRSAVWFTTLDARAKALRQAGDPRTVAQLRYDLATGSFPCDVHVPADATPAPTAVDLGADTAAAAGGLRPSGLSPASPDCRLARPVQAMVTVPVETALGLSGEPGWLSGYGWLSAPQCRQLLLDAELRAVLVEHRSGAALDLAERDVRPAPTASGVRDALVRLALGPGGAGAHELSDLAHRSEAAHDPSDRLSQFVRLRDRFDDGPGAALTSAARCDLDHDTPYDHHHPPDGGPTAAWNLASRARRTHLLKHDGWTPERSATATTWTSPCGQVVRTPNWTTSPPGIDPAVDPDGWRFAGPDTLPDAERLASIDAELTWAPTPDDLAPTQWLLDPADAFAGSAPPF